MGFQEPLSSRWRFFSCNYPLFKNLVGIVCLDNEVLDIRESVWNESTVSGEEYCSALGMINEESKGRYIVLYREWADSEITEMDGFLVFQYNFKVLGDSFTLEHIFVCSYRESVGGKVFYKGSVVKLKVGMANEQTFNIGHIVIHALKYLSCFNTSFYK